jgi:hypothetical protein
MARSRRRVVVLSLAAFLGVVSTAQAAEGLSMREARQAALLKVEKLERKLRDTGARTSGVPGCWREGRRAVGCLGMVRGADELVKWRCAVPMTVRKRATASASSHRIRVEFTDTMCAF